MGILQPQKVGSLLKHKLQLNTYLSVFEVEGVKLCKGWNLPVDKNNDI